jgi:3-isopropylmalate/(R)-2-methylmalate dehydratase small subunit
MKVVSKLGDDVSTDTIYPGRFMATVLPTETPKFAFADDVELNTRLVSGDLPKGSVIVADRNFGCGSSREQAVSTLKGYELTIVAKGIARIFLQNSINLGLNVVICPEIEAEVGDELVVEPDKVINATKNRTFAVTALPASKQAVIDAGGLIEYTRARLMAR